MLGADPTLTIAENYRRFARFEVATKSPIYRMLCERIADDPQLLEFLAEQPEAKRQPNLLLAAVRVLFGLQTDFRALRDAVLDHRREVAAVLLSHRTQTNEPGRCAALLPLLAALAQPLALLEVGAAAGLCLLVDRYGYDYGGVRIGPSDVVFECTPHGDVPIPAGLPEVVWRMGIDLEPVNLDDPKSVRWLEALVWPEEEDRLERLRASIAIARRDRPRVVRGDLLNRLEEIAALAPTDATLVVFHTAVLAYLSPEEREQFRRRVGALPGTWLANEGTGVLADLELPETAPAADSHFVLAQDGRPRAYCDPHGRWIQWL